MEACKSLSLRSGARSGACAIDIDSCAEQALIRWSEQVQGQCSIVRRPHLEQACEASRLDLFDDLSRRCPRTSTGEYAISNYHSTGLTLSFSQFETDSNATIPLTLLARQDPVQDQILFYDDVALFEDELHDNGESIMNVRIVSLGLEEREGRMILISLCLQRVMPHCFFILQRLFLRVDNVLFRIRDVRIYHSFGTDTIVRETSGWEAKYSTVKSVRLQ